MSGSDPQTVAGSRRASRLYRRPPGFGWLAALAAIPLLLAVLGHGIAERSTVGVGGPDVAGPSLTLPAGPEFSAEAGPAPTAVPDQPSFAPLAILRNGSVVTVNGDLPDIGARTALLGMLTDVFGDRVRLVDNLVITPGVTAPDSAGVGAMLKAASSVRDFKFQLNGDAVTLKGTAGSEAVKSAVAAAATAAWPNLKIADEIRVAAAAPEVPSGCGALRADVAALMQTPVTFMTNGYTLTAGAQEQLGRVAQQLAGCPDARVAVNGYADTTGNDAVNIPLSGSRAKSVADFLVSHGVPADHVTAQGFGSADPVASNATPDGRAQNRRITIVVS